MRALLLKSVIVLGLIAYISFNVSSMSGTVVPVKKVTSPSFKLLSSMGIVDEELAGSYDMASSRTGISRELLIALTYTESAFKQRAVSSKNYKGLMQIPYPLWHPDTNILVGAYILCEKLVITKGDIRRAISLYKGYGINDRGLQQADKVIKLSKQLKEEV